jgi:uncharacterized protein YqeY
MLEEKIYQDYVAALRERDKHKTDFLSFVRAELKNAAIELKKKELADDEALVVLKKQKKRLEEAKESISASGRKDMLESLERELGILDAYLPSLLGEGQLREIVDQVILEMGASSLKDMGKVMKEVLTRVGVRAEAKTVSELVRNRLAS